jgi:hypothetical protein
MMYVMSLLVFDKIIDMVKDSDELNIYSINESENNTMKYCQGPNCHRV